MKSIFKILLLVMLCGVSVFSDDGDGWLDRAGRLFGSTKMPAPLSGREYERMARKYFAYDYDNTSQMEAKKFYSSLCQAGFAPACGDLAVDYYLNDEIFEFDLKKAKELLTYSANNTPDKPFVIIDEYFLDLVDEMIEAGARNVKDAYKVDK